MGLMDKFLSAMNINDDMLDEDDYLDDEDEMPEVKEPKKRIKPRKRPKKEEKQKNQYVEKEEVVEEEPAPVVKPSKPRPIWTSPKSDSMRGGKRGGGMEVCVIKPKGIDDAKEVTDTLLSDCAVILNTEGMELDLAQRIIDFICGSIYTFKGDIKKINNSIFLITPATVDATGDFQELFGSFYDGAV